MRFGVGTPFTTHDSDGLWWPFPIDPHNPIGSFERQRDMACFVACSVPSMEKQHTHTHTHGWQVKLLEKSNIQFTPYLSNPSMTQVHHTHLALHPFPSKNLTCHSAKTPARSTALRATSSESVGRRRSALGREGLQGLQRLRGRLRHLRRTDRRKGAHDVGIFGMHLTTWSNRIGT